MSRGLFSSSQYSVYWRSEEVSPAQSPGGHHVDRNPRGVTPTAYGNVLYRHADKLPSPVRSTDLKDQLTLGNPLRHVMQI